MVGADIGRYDIILVRAGIPQQLLGALWTIGVKYQQAIARQRGDGDRFLQRDGRVGVQQAAGFAVNRLAGNVIGGSVFQVDRQRGKTRGDIHQGKMAHRKFP